ncbi:hypothetical protein AALA69_03360 [Eggerthellaceae bacterium 24-137]
MPNHKKTIIRRATEAFTSWLCDNSAAAKFERTVAQGVLGVVAAAISAATGMPEWLNALVAPSVMAVLAPSMDMIGKSLEVSVYGDR